MEEKTEKITAKEARRLYDRMYYAKNRERIREQKRQYWERIASKMNAALAEEGERNNEKQ